MRSLFLLLPLMLVAADTGEYTSSLDSWRAAYERGLKAPDGWLSVAGLFWLQEGVNRIGSEERNEIRLPQRCGKSVGAIEFQKGHAAFHAHPGAAVLLNGKAVERAALKNDKGQSPDVLQVRDVSLTVIQRGKRFGVRMRDPQSRALREFRGLQWFPADEAYRIRARWLPYHPPKQIPVTNVLGDTENEPSPGCAQFTLNGKQYKLEPVLEDPGELFFMFKDATSAHETYGAGRFLKTDMPKDGFVELDFNRAYNPPCAYISFATCPLPPRQNHLNARVAAGQKKYGGH